MSEELEQSFTMPSNPVDRKKIKDALHEMAGLLQFIEDKRSTFNDAASMIQEEYTIPKKIVAKMARTLHKHNYSDVVHESDVFTTMFETLFQTEVVDGTQSEVDDE